jgi:glutamine synthetase
MAKPMTGEPGSAMHLHQSMVDIATGKNIFSNEDGSMSELFLTTSAACRSSSPRRCRCSRPTSTRSAASCRTPRRR